MYRNGSVNKYQPKSGNFVENFVGNFCWKSGFFGFKALTMSATTSKRTRVVTKSNASFVVRVEGVEHKSHFAQGMHEVDVLLPPGVSCITTTSAGNESTPHVRTESTWTEYDDDTLKTCAIVFKEVCTATKSSLKLTSP